MLINCAIGVTISVMEINVSCSSTFVFWYCYQNYPFLHINICQVLRKQSHTDKLCLVE